MSNLVWEHFPKGGSEKLIMLRFADHANNNGERIFPSIKTLSLAVCLSESQTRRIVHKLIDEGWVAVVANAKGGAPGRTRRYKLNLEKLARTGDTNPRGSADAKRRASAEARDSSHGCIKGVASVRERASVNESRTINNHQLTTNKQPRLTEQLIAQGFFQRAPLTEEQRDWIAANDLQKRDEESANNYQERCLSIIRKKLL